MSIAPAFTGARNNTTDANTSLQNAAIKEITTPTAFQSLQQQLSQTAF